MKFLILLLALTSCGYSLKAQVVFEPAEEQSSLAIGEAKDAQISTNSHSAY